MSVGQKRFIIGAVVLIGTTVALCATLVGMAADTARLKRRVNRLEDRVLILEKFRGLGISTLASARHK